ncbi:MAG: hypothetical protein Q8L93_03240 [Rhodocyclaceae bacterium]|nr:hypothetical protein [Rhodocyclaceae bacterium]
MPGYSGAQSRIGYGTGVNIGWWDQDQGLGDPANNGLLNINHQPSSNGSYNIFTYTPRSGELGNDIINVTRALTLLPWYVRSRHQHGVWFNFRFANGDYPGAAERVLLHDGARLLSLPRLELFAPGINGWTGKAAQKTIGMTASNTLSSQTGSTSYNHTRGELAVVASSGDAANRFVIRLFAVRFDERIDVTAIPDTPIIETTVDLASGVWPRWNNEARFRVSCVLQNNGDLVLTGFHSSNTTSGSESLRSIRLTRNADHSFTVPGAVTAALATHGATYCMDKRQHLDGYEDPAILLRALHAALRAELLLGRGTDRPYHRPQDGHDHAGVLRRHHLWLYGAARRR